MSKAGERPVGHLSELQTLVDDLAATLGRSVAVDNPRFELLCASAQIGPVDQIRVNAIIDRAPPRPPLPWMLSLGVATSTVPVRLPRNDEFGMLPRVCFPIRRDGLLLGYLWLFDEPPVTDPDLAETGRTVAAFAPLLAADDAEIRERADILARLLTAAITDATAVAAIAEARDLGYLADTPDALLVHVARLQPRRRSRTPPLTGRDLELAVARRQIGRSFLARVADDDLVTVSNIESRADVRDFESMLIRTTTSARYSLTAAGAAAAATPADLPEAVRRAQFSAELSRSQPPANTYLRWENLGSWRLLYGRPLRAETITALSDDAERLLREGSPEQWQTVVAYLDAGRRVEPTCEALSIHRATLYYRLNRVRELLGGDALDDGWRATSLHAALKLHHHLVDSGER